MSRTFYPNQFVGEYRIVEFLGAGGMGEVYRAEHSKIGRVAAVKALTQATQGAGFVERFFNEARIQASLQHPNVAALYDFSEITSPEGARVPYIIMEYVDGQTIAERLEAYGGPLPLSETVYIFEKVCEAIEYIHRHGIIHRDIKSNNIKVSTRGEVKLLDFGIAKGQMSPGLTQVGSVIGTLQYLAPELIRGGVADQRGDIWALGVLLYEMVAGSVPFHAETIGDLCDRIKSVSYTPPERLNPGLPREAAEIITRCLRERPSDRYNDAGELLRDVRRLSAAAQPGAGIAAADRHPSDGHAAPERGGGPGRVALFGGAVAVLVLLLVVGAVTLVYLSRTGDEPAVNASGLVGPNAGPGAGADPKGRKPPTKAGSTSSSPDGEERTIELQMVEGAAEVYRGGERLGTTPYYIKARVGERVRLTLRRDGYADEPVDFTVTEKKVYTFDMRK
ncbi:MAG TPA: serine/threonine-protein kinase [Pyrinomonadaceae bacterium]|nr:serine/threonine-protein kinase [Pyrinomonadaceae bacterium]